MIVIPAIDLKDGRCVRLIQGDARREVRYDGDPVEIARRWVEAGATWLHVVDLDGAFAGRPVHLAIVREIAAAVSARVQAGGGFRRAADIEAALRAGVTRVVVGTAAPALGEDLFRHLGERLTVAIDVKDGRLAIEGWTAVDEGDPVQVAKDLQAQGARRFVYTATARDGMLAGPDLQGLRALVEALSAPVTAAGGISCPADLVALEGIGVEAAIVGRALYEGMLDSSVLLMDGGAC